MADDPRLEQRDLGSLPDGAVLRFEAISRGKDPQNDHRLLLFEDGRAFVAWYGEDGFPPEPSAVLDAEALAEIRGLLAEADLDHGPARRSDPALEDGMWQIITTRTDGGGSREVVFEGVPSPLADRLQRLASEVAG